MHLLYTEWIWDSVRLGYAEQPSPLQSLVGNLSSLVSTWHHNAGLPYLRTGVPFAFCSCKDS